MFFSRNAFVQPLLTETSPHSASCGVKVFRITLVSLLMGLGFAVLVSWVPSSDNGSRQHSASENPTLDMATVFQPHVTATSNRFLQSPWQSSSKRFQSPRVEARAQLLENTWQARLDKALLNVDVAPTERLSLLQGALTDPMLTEDLRSAVSILQDKGMQGGHPEVIEKLWPKGTTARADLEGLNALRRQVPEVLQDIQNQAQSPRGFLPATTDVDATALPDLTSVFSSLQNLLTDADRQKEIIEETKDLLRSTPQGLETPEYNVVRMMDGPMLLGVPEPIELRKYEAFTVARTSMKGAGLSGATGFNTLASYLFGNNQGKQEMKMTMPVETSLSSGDSQGSMAFVLPKKYADDAPEPLASSNITLEKVPTRLVVAKPFPGIVTDDEVQRQKVALLEAIAADGSLTPVDEDQVTVLQYNSPLTLPYRRRNEVAIVVTENAAKSVDATVVTENAAKSVDAVAKTFNFDGEERNSQGDLEGKVQNEMQGKEENKAEGTAEKEVEGKVDEGKPDNVAKWRARFQSMKAKNNE